MINLFNIERFATHDGEGIRTVIFLQGCPLSCPWCSNPESQQIKTHLFYSQEKCVKCKRCEQLCPVQAIHFTKDQFAFNNSLCKQCGICIQHCLHNALHFVGKKMSIDDIISEVTKDQEYYDESNGGITISGGEPFVQFEALMKLLKKLKQNHFHVCVETTGQYPLEQLKQANEYIDAYLFDIKHVDKEKLASINADATMIQTNLFYLAENYKEKITIRVPIIPAFNYDKDTLHQILSLVSQLQIRELHFLPYHRMGKAKYEKMLLQYPWYDQEVDPKELEPYLAVAKFHKLHLVIGG